MKTSSLSIRRASIDALTQDPVNARLHGGENLAAIEASLRRFGQAEPLVVQKKTGRVIGGNGRLVVMKKLGWTECDVVDVDVSDIEAMALGIALNRTAELAAWDEPVLAKLLEELRTVSPLDGLDGVGYSSTDLDVLHAELANKTPFKGITDEDDIPEQPEAATTRPGDLWILGEHRLLCGDSASVEDLDRLLGGARVHLVNTDPPYNVRVEPRSNNAIAAGSSGFAASEHHQRFDLARRPHAASPTTKKLRPRDRFLQGDFLPDDEFDVLLRSWFGNLSRVLEPGRAFYIWGGYSNWKNYCAALADSGLYFSHGIIWVKEHPVLTRKDMMGNYESCWHGWREGAAHQWFGPDNITDVWTVKKVNPQSMIRLTEKPVELARRAIEYSSRAGENVLDLFGGSGSTLIAAEATRRKAYLMEIDALYTDVIVIRWEKFTGKVATLDGSGKSFQEVAAERKAAIVEAEPPVAENGQGNG